jgi:hypothetical protein
MKFEWKCFPTLEDCQLVEHKVKHNLIPQIFDSKFHFHLILKKNFFSKDREIFQVNAGTWGLHNNLCYHSGVLIALAKRKKETNSWWGKLFPRKKFMLFFLWNLWLRSIKIFSDILESYKRELCVFCIIMLTLSSREREKEIETYSEASLN